jgi:hypothetical protein
MISFIHGCSILTKLSSEVDRKQFVQENIAVASCAFDGETIEFLSTPPTPLVDAVST